MKARSKTKQNKTKQKQSKAKDTSEEMKASKL
jgi:hypothetical protein